MRGGGGHMTWPASKTYSKSVTDKSVGRSFVKELCHNFYFSSMETKKQRAAKFIVVIKDNLYYLVIPKELVDLLFVRDRKISPTYSNRKISK